MNFSIHLVLVYAYSSILTDDTNFRDIPKCEMTTEKVTGAQLIAGDLWQTPGDLYQWCQIN